MKELICQENLMTVNCTEIIDSVIEKNQDYRYMSIKKRQIIHKKIYSSIRGLGIIEELLENLILQK